MESKRQLIRVLIVLPFVALPGVVTGQDRPEREHRPTVRATGEAIVTAKPDQAVINIGVVTQASTAQAAGAQNAQQLDTVLAELRKALQSAGDVKTLSYSLSPVYHYPKDGGQPDITGYTATNILQVKVNDLTQVGRIIDAATQSGANTIQSLQFGLKDEHAVRAQALREAAMQGKAKAEAIASALGVRILRLISAEESATAIVPRVYQPMAATAGRAPAPTSVEPGNIEVHATVVVVYEIGA